MCIRDSVNIVEQLMMGNAIVRRIEVPLRQTFLSTGMRGLHLKNFKAFRIPNVEAISKNRRSWVDVGIVEGPVAFRH